MSDKKIGIIKFSSLICKSLPGWNFVNIAILLILIQSVATLFLPIVTMNFIDTFNKDINIFKILLIISIFLFQLIISSLMIYTITYISQFIVKKLRNSLWEKTLKLPIKYFDKNPSAEIMSKISNDTQIMKDFITHDFINFISGIVTVLGSIALLFYIDWKMSLLIIISVPITVICVSLISRRAYDISKAMQDGLAKLQVDLSRVLTAIRLVKSCVAEKNEIKKGSKRVEYTFKLGLKEGKIFAIIQPFTSTLIFLLLIVIFGYGTIRVSNNSLSAGSLVAVVYYLFQIISPCSQMTNFVAQLNKSMGAAERVYEIFDEPGELDILSNSQKDKASNISQNSLSFINVCFCYNDKKPILNKLNFDIELGKLTAIVGLSGVGKTTIFSLIERFYTPQKGYICYKGNYINLINLSDWRKEIAYVSQECPIMLGTIKSNLTYGMEFCSESKISNVLKEVGLLEFINSLPEGLNTETGEQGIKLSGGQRQRIAIARAMLQNPNILLLDEATSHLDSNSEEIVQNALKKLMKNRTTLVIAHRLSTVKYADKIIMIQDGAVSGLGTHKTLLEDNNLYKQLVNQQFVENN